MSLINEALRKARQAASEHDSKQPDGVFRPARAYPSRRSGRGGPLTVALIAIAAGVVGASAAWWFLGDRPTASNESIVNETRLIDAVTPAIASEASLTPAEARSESDSIETSVEQIPTTVNVDAADPTEAAQIESTPETAVMEDEAAGPVGDRIFVIEAELGYASLTLGFIVARSTNPFAEINGTEVRVGSEIDGFVVEAIESDRVVLRDDKGPLVLRVP